MGRVPAGTLPAGRNLITVTHGMLFDPWRRSGWSLSRVLLDLAYSETAAIGDLQPQTLDNFANIEVSASIPFASFS